MPLETSGTVRALPLTRRITLPLPRVMTKRRECQVGRWSPGAIGRPGISVRLPDASRQTQTGPFGSSFSDATRATGALAWWRRWRLRDDGVVVEPTVLLFA